MNKGEVGGKREVMLNVELILFLWHILVTFYVSCTDVKIKKLKNFNLFYYVIITM